VITTRRGHRRHPSARRSYRGPAVAFGVLVVALSFAGCPAITPPPQAPPPTPVPAAAEPMATPTAVVSEPTPVPPTPTPTLPAATPTPTSTPTPTAVAAEPTPVPPTATPTPTPTPGPVNGAVEISVRMITSEGQAAGADTVAWLPAFPAAMNDAVTVTVAQRDKTFIPRVAVVPVGSTVEFPNYDRVFHNVFSLSAPRTFDLGLYRNGRSKAERFPDPGLVQVYCNIHPQMEASLMVVDARLFGSADESGRIRVESVPPGTWKVKLWNRRAGFSDHEVTVPTGGVGRVEVVLDVSDWRPTPHLNKHGEEYPPPDDDDFRY
jgi:plastocyanin